MSDSVGNPEDRFSHKEAQISIYHKELSSLWKFNDRVMLVLLAKSNLMELFIGTVLYLRVKACITNVVLSCLSRLRRWQLIENEIR